MRQLGVPIVRRELKQYILDKYTIEDMITYVGDEIDERKFLEFLIKSGVNMRIFEDFMDADLQMELHFNVED
jgi:hypothetical protein